MHKKQMVSFFHTLQHCKWMENKSSSGKSLKTHSNTQPPSLAQTAVAISHPRGKNEEEEEEAEEGAQRIYY